MGRVSLNNSLLAITCCLPYYKHKFNRNSTITHKYLTEIVLNKNVCIHTDLSVFNTFISKLFVVVSLGDVDKIKMLISTFFF